MTAITTDSGATGDRITNDNDAGTTFTVNGGEVGATITVELADVDITGTKFDIVDHSDNTYTLTVKAGVTLADGVYTVKAADAAGNVVTGQTFTIDATAPSVPTNPIDLPDGSDTGSSATDNTTSTTAPTLRVYLTGTNAAVGDTIELLLGGASLTTAVTKVLDSTDVGNAYVDLTVTDGDLDTDGNKVFTAQVTDVAGNVGTAGGSLTVALDTTAPSLTTGAVIDVLTASDNGTNTTDNISSDSSPQVRITFINTGAVANDVVSLYSGSSVIATATLSATDVTNGITVTPGSALGADGTYVLKAVITDAAGNVGVVDSNTISYQLDAANDAPTATLVSVSSTDFVILAADADVQPDWNSLTLDSGGITLVSSAGGTSSLNNGADTTFTIGTQAILVGKALSVSDGVATAVAVTSGGVAVQVNAGTDFAENIGANNGVINISYGFDDDDNMLGGDKGDYLFGGAGDDVIRGRAGDDEVTGGTGADTFTFEATSNGLDTIKDFNDTEGDILDLDAIITGGEYNTAGTAIVEGSTSAIALADVNNKFVYFQVADVSSATIDEASLFAAAAEFAAEGTTAGIEFILAVGEASGAHGVNLYQVTDGAGEDDMSITQIASIEGNSLADILTANLDVT